MPENEFRPKPLSQQTIVITGASSGIGLATALMAAEKGANVVLSSRNEEDLKEIVRQIEASGGKALAVTADVARPEDMENLREQAVAVFGGIDTWVNNAGASMYGRLRESALEDERQIFETNFWGVRHGSQAALPVLSKSGGVLINIGSEVSAAAIPLQGVYSASKHAVKAYTDALRMELEKEGLPVVVTLVRPAGIDTPYPRHAMNALPSGEPSLPPPVYHPNVVARAILHSAVHPRRDVYVGAPARLFEILQVFFPRVMDRMMEKMLFRQQATGTDRPHDPREEGLHGPPAFEGQMRGGHPGHVSRTSLYTEATLHPWRTLLILGGASLVLRKVLRSARA